MNETTITLAEALLRRKELQGILTRLEPIKAEGLFTLRVRRQKVTEDLEEVTANVPRITPDLVDAYYNHIARQLRQIDACIQRANWETKLEVPTITLQDFKGGIPADDHKNAINLP